MNIRFEELIEKLNIIEDQIAILLDNDSPYTKYLRDNEIKSLSDDYTNVALILSRLLAWRR